MSKVNRSALMPYSAIQMYAVVNDVEAYPEFLPWCTGAEVLDQDDSSMVAKLVMSKGAIRQSFTTRNLLSYGESIRMELVDGPFSNLSGHWLFTQLGDDGCRIAMDMSFDFDSRLFNLTLSGIFNVAADRMVDAFCARAETIYG